MNSSPRCKENGPSLSWEKGDVGGAAVARGKAQSKMSSLYSGARCEQLPCAPQQLSARPQPESCWFSPGPSFLDQSHHRKPFLGSHCHYGCFCQLFTAGTAPQELRLSVSTLRKASAEPSSLHYQAPCRG